MWSSTKIQTRMPWTIDSSLQIPSVKFWKSKLMRFPSTFLNPSAGRIESVRFFLEIVSDGKIKKLTSKNDSAMISKRERLLRWLFDVVWQLSIITGCPEMLEKLSLRIRPPDGFNPSGFFSIRPGRIRRDNFSEPQKSIPGCFCDWAGFFIARTARLAIVNIRRTSKPSQKYLICVDCFRSRNFGLSRNFLKNVPMKKWKKSYQKMILRWNQKGSGFSNPCRPPGIVWEVSGHHRRLQIEIRPRSAPGGLNPPRIRPGRIESAPRADWETAQKSHQFWLSELQK